MEFTHFNTQGRAHMVDVGGKPETDRMARARAVVHMQASTLEMIVEGRIAKGDVLAVAQVAGIMAAKRTWEIIPMCHPIIINAVDMDFHIDREGSRIIITSRVDTTGRTGVEMEALTAVSAAALTIYDMCKSVDRWMTIEEISLLEKAGGKSGHLFREGGNNTYEG